MLGDFDYPTAQRSDTMHLQTIERGGAALKRRGRPHDAALAVADIEGAQASTTSTFRMMKLVNRPDLQHNLDVERSSPMRLIPEEVRRPNAFNISNADIEGTKAKPRGFRTNRVVDPNNPRYTLPSYEPCFIPVPKQLAETNKVDDIAGSRSKPPCAGAVHDVLGVADIPGAKASTTYAARKLQSGKDRPPDNPTRELDNSKRFDTARQTDPLTPRYDYDIPKELSEEDRKLFSTIPGSHPRPSRPGRTEATNLMSLRTSDISGAQPHRKLPGPQERREVHNPVDISDIPDAHPTVLHAAFHYKRTQRCVDPLDPAYPELKWKSDIHPSSGAQRQVSRANQSHMDSPDVGRFFEHRQPSGGGDSEAGSVASSAVRIPAVMSLPKTHAL